MARKAKELVQVDIETGVWSDGSGKWGYIIWSADYDKLAEGGFCDTSEEAYDEGAAVCDEWYGTDGWTN